MLKEKYRPVGVFPCVSKVFEGVFVDQLSCYFQNFLSPYISGFGKGHDYQSVLVRFTESIKHHLDNKQVAGAFDCHTTYCCVKCTHTV